LSAETVFSGDGTTLDESAAKIIKRKTFRRIQQ
jgi:hypothetical protein